MKLLLATITALAVTIHGQSAQVIFHIDGHHNDGHHSDGHHSDGHHTDGHHECPTFWLPFRGHCYRFFGDRVPWQEALDTCREHFSHNGRADLASIHNVQENSFLYNLFHSSAGDTPLSAPPYYGAWIGLHQETPGSTGPFFWTDGSPFGADDYHNWRTAQPDNWQGNEDCVHFWRWTIEDDIAQPWNDLLCTENLPFICQMDP